MNTIPKYQFTKNHVYIFWIIPTYFKSAEEMQQKPLLGSHVKWVFWFFKLRWFMGWFQRVILIEMVRIREWLQYSSSCWMLSLRGREYFVIQVWTYQINKFDLFDLSWDVWRICPMYFNVFHRHLYQPCLQLHVLPQLLVLRVSQRIDIRIP